MRRIYIAIGTALAVVSRTALPAELPRTVFDPTAYGAKGDGQANVTSPTMMDVVCPGGGQADLTSPRPAVRIRPSLTRL